MLYARDEGIDMRQVEKWRKCSHGNLIETEEVLLKGEGKGKGDKGRTGDDQIRDNIHRQQTDWQTEL